MKTRSGRPASQHPHELAEFIALLQRENVTSYLEIGARHGDTFFEVMKSLPVGSFGVAVDLPGGPWGTLKSVPFLDGAAAELRDLGYLVEVLYGDSSGTEVPSTLALHYGRFDAILIDGDHRYEGARADWDIYRHRGRLVALHDIAGVDQTQRSSGLPVEVPQLWAEIAAEPLRTREIVAPNSSMGIGVAWP